MEHKELILSYLKKYPNGIALGTLAKICKLPNTTLKRKLRQLEDLNLVNKRYDENQGALLYLLEEYLK